MNLREDTREGERIPNRRFVFGKVLAPLSAPPDHWDWLREVYIHFRIFQWRFFIASGYYTRINTNKLHHWRKFRTRIFRQ
jgi:hypothetical protein